MGIPLSRLHYLQTPLNIQRLQTKTQKPKPHLNRAVFNFYRKIRLPEFAL